MGLDRAYHLPVMLQETLRLLDPHPGKIIVDATLGGGGHANAIAQKLRPGGRLIGIDQDHEAIEAATAALAEVSDVVTFREFRFDLLDFVLDDLGISEIDGILFDFGVSSHQLDTPSRGFSFKDADAELDMRMNTSSESPNAADLLNSLSENELTRILRDNSDEHWAARIAQFVIKRRIDRPFRTVGDLVETVHAAMPAAARPTDKNASTRTFQALRIAVNDEIAVLKSALNQALTRLSRGGVIVTLTYHSIEDRAVKQLLAPLIGKGQAEDPYGNRLPATFELLTKKPLIPGLQELSANPRARSAKLRAARRI